jgi:uncharacterized membrane protein YagU involved in acid resistance
MVVAILLGGLVAGTLDIGAACLINNAPPAGILRAIAGGLLGKSASTGGLPIAGLGLVLQWAMSILIAAIFVIAGRWMPILRRRWIEAGLAYGVVVFFVMNYVVLPLSAIGHAPRFRIVHFSEDMVAMLVFGLIVAHFASRTRAHDSATAHMIQQPRSMPRRSHLLTSLRVDVRQRVRLARQIGKNDPRTLWMGESRPLPVKHGTRSPLSNISQK